jgi:hypothetical protein
MFLQRIYTKCPARGTPEFVHPFFSPFLDAVMRKRTLSMDITILGPLSYTMEKC